MASIQPIQSVNSLSPAKKAAIVGGVAAVGLTVAAGIKGKKLNPDAKLLESIKQGYTAFGEGIQKGAKAVWEKAKGIVEDIKSKFPKKAEPTPPTPPAE